MRIPFSGFNQISIPNSVTDLNENSFERWMLTPSKIELSNSKYKIVDNKYLIGKTDIKNADFDDLICVIADGVRDFIIPSSIKIIRSFAFYQKWINTINIPSSVTVISNSAFYCCHNLENVIFYKDSKLTTIGQKAFSRTIIQRFCIPSHVTELNEEVFLGNIKLSHIEIPINSELKIIKKRSFVDTNVKSISLPSSCYEFQEGWCSSSN